MKKVHQIFISDSQELPTGQLKKRMEDIQTLYADYEYCLYTDNLIQQLLIDNFDPSILIAYRDLKAYAQKADLAKMCILYVYGGYYFDLGILVHKYIDFSASEIVLVNGIQHPVHTVGLPVIENNFLYVREPKHPIIKKIIDKIVDNVYKLNYGCHPLDITAPIALGRVVSNTEKSVTYCNVKLDEEENKSVWYKNEKFYDFKPSKENADISKMGAVGTNRYDTLWFNTDSFNIRLSYIMITHNPADANKKIVEKKCIQSIISNLRDEDELIIVGDVDHLSYLTTTNIKLVDEREYAKSKKISALRNAGVAASTGNVVINLDNDVMLLGTFSKSLLNYIRNNKDFDTLNVKMYLPNGGRCWDRATFNLDASIKDNISMFLKMVNYDYPGNNLWYNGPFIIRKRYIAEQFKFNEEMLYNEGEEIELSKRLIENGFRIKIDKNNIVFHVDNTLLHVISADGTQRIVRNIDRNDRVVTDNTIASLFRNMFARF